MKEDENIKILHQFIRVAWKNKSDQMQ